MLPFAFAITAAPFAAAAIINAKLVIRHGMRKPAHAAMLALIAVNTAQVVAVASGVETATTFVAFMCLSMFALGFVGANATAIAMEPMGHIAGSAAAMHGFTTSMGAALLGAAAGRFYADSTISIAMTFVVLGAAAMLFAFWAESGRLFSEPHSMSDASA